MRDTQIFIEFELVSIESSMKSWPNEADFDPATLHDWDKVGEAMITMARSWPASMFSNTEQPAEMVTQ